MICGNDDPRVFEDAVELYRNGIAKKVIISGGIGRLSAGLIDLARNKFGIDIDVAFKIPEAEIILQILNIIGSKYEIVFKENDNALLERKSSNTPQKF